MAVVFFSLSLLLLFIQNARRSIRKCAPYCINIIFQWILMGSPSPPSPRFQCGGPFLHIRLAPVTIWWGGGASLPDYMKSWNIIWWWWWLYEGKKNSLFSAHLYSTPWWYERERRVPIRAKNAAQLPQQRLHAERGTARERRVKREASSSIFLSPVDSQITILSFAVPRLLLLLLRAVS